MGATMLSPSLSASVGCVAQKTTPAPMPHTVEAQAIAFPWVAQYVVDAMATSEVVPGPTTTEVAGVMASKSRTAKELHIVGSVLSFPRFDDGWLDFIDDTAWKHPRLL